MKFLVLSICVGFLYIVDANKGADSQKSGYSFIKSQKQKGTKNSVADHVPDKKSHRPKIEKRSLLTKDSNTMLMLDSSNGFQSAIQKDIDDLNNPSFSQEAKRSDVSESEKIYIIKEPNQELSKSSKDVESTKSDGDTKISEIIMNQIRYIQALELEKQRYVCIIGDRKNCSDQSSLEPTINSSTLPKNDGQQPITPPSVKPENGSSQKPSSSICTEFSDWSPCSDICIGGKSMRYRYCYDELGRVSYDKDSKDCSDPSCSYCTDWSPYSACDKMCGSGTKTKTRNCYNKNGSVFQDVAKDTCNFHPCQPKCGQWSPWSECSKACDTGVKIRERNCTLDDGSTKTFYEHRACNTQPCLKGLSNTTRPYYEYPDEESCLSSHISFERFRIHALTLFDNTLEQNDVEYKGMVLFNGNLSCGISGVLTGKESVIKYYDDIFRNFDYSTLSVAFWIFPIRSEETKTAIQTLFSFSSKKYDFGKYAMVLNQEYQPTFFYQTQKSFIVGKTDFVIAPDAWHHIGVSYSDEDQSISFFHNGVAIPLSLSKMSASEAKPGLFPEDGFQGFGNDATLSSSFSGGIDEIYVHKCPLTQEQAHKIANTCRSRSKTYCPTPQHGLCHAAATYKNYIDVTQPPAVQQTFTPLNSS